MMRHPMVTRTGAVAAILLIALASLLAPTLGAALAQSQPGQPEQGVLDDPVPGKEGVTFVDLARLAMPDIAPDNGIYAATPPPGLRHIAPDFPARPTPGRSILLDAIHLPVVSGGKQRLMVIFDFGPALQEGEGFAILALYDLSADPKLLDMANVAMGYQTYLMYPSSLDIGAGQTILVIAGYDQTDIEAKNGVGMVLARDDRLELVDDFSLLSHFSCAADFNQNADFSLVAPTKPYTDFQVVVTETVDPTGQSCPGETSPVSSSRTVTVLYRWDALVSRYRPDSDALKVLVAETAKRF